MVSASTSRSSCSKRHASASPTTSASSSSRITSPSRCPRSGASIAFFAAIGEPLEDEDPSDRLLDVETQLGWLRELGFDDVDCYWKWLEMALLVGVKPHELR